MAIEYLSIASVSAAAADRFTAAEAFALREVRCRILRSPILRYDIILQTDS